MRTLAPLALFLFLFALPGASEEPIKSPKEVPVKPQPRDDPEDYKAPRMIPGLVIKAGEGAKLKEPPPVKIEESVRKNVQKLGFDFDKKGDLLHKESGTKIDKIMMIKAGILVNADGFLVFRDQPDMKVKEEHLKGILDGLLNFGKVNAHDPRKTGRILQAWGIPPAYDGVHMINPDGSATYFGLMLYEGLRKNPDRLKNLSGERLSKALALFKTGYGTAFGQQLPDAGQEDLKRGWRLLNWETNRPGETVLKLKPYSDIGDSIGAYKDLIEGEAKVVQAGGVTPQGFKKASDAALAALNKLERYRYHSEFDITPRPVPSPKQDKPAKEGDYTAPKMMGPGNKPTPPEHNMLPKLLKMVERLHGSPMSLGQQEAFIKSFPMGETVWRMGAHKLWRQGITGKNVKVAVIDTGVDYHPHLGDAVKERKAYTRQRGAKTTGMHGTHVAGTIHAMAPDAEIRSYQALDEENRNRQKNDNIETYAAVETAIDDAVKDGNQVINLSLGFFMNPSDSMTKKIQKHAENGVIFVIAAGNEGPNRGMRTPTSAPNAITVGALDTEGRITTFSSSGEKWDPEKMAYSIKNVFMAPGKNIASTVKPPFRMSPDQQDFTPMSGTSMASPHVTGSVALLLNAVKDFKLFPDPVTASKRIRDSLSTTGKQMSLDELPSGVPPEQDFIIIDPNAAYQHLRGSG